MYYVQKSVYYVQKICTEAYERQGLVEYDGPAERVSDWVVGTMEAGITADQIEVIEDGVMGWEDYSRIVRMPDASGNGGIVYYLL